MKNRLTCHSCIHRKHYKDISVVSTSQFWRPMFKCEIKNIVVGVNHKACINYD